jgi:hypothetical protein
MTPRDALRSSISASDTAQSGKPLTKFEVPSIGSSTHVGPD